MTDGPGSELGMPVGGGPPIDQATGVTADLAVDEAAAVEAADLLAPYVPQRFLTAIGASEHADPVWIDSLQSSMVLADVSGFTPLSERLAAEGREGAERLTSILNLYFERMLSIARERGGENLKFGGDALLILFTGADHEGRATACALTMQRATGKFPSIRVGNDRFKLRMSAGVHSSTFWFAAVGDPALRMQHLVLGAEASRLANAEGAAPHGEVFITPETREALGARCEAEPVDEFFRADALTDPVRPAPDEGSGPAARFGALIPFLPPPVQRAVREGGRPAHLEAEHRKVSVVFISVTGGNDLLERSGPDALLDEMQSYVGQAIRLVHQHHGFVVSTDIDGRGLKLIIAFGAPVAHGDDPANALRFTAELDAALPGLGLELRHRIGINSGFVYAGDIGSTFRREYTVMGDAVNLSARLMGAAPPGAIYLSQQVAEEAGAGFRLRRLKPIRVKGKADPIPIARLYGTRAATPDTVSRRAPLVGRAEELARLKQLFRGARDGTGRTALLIGEAGAGKSRLLAEALRTRRSSAWRVLRAAGLAHTTATPFLPWTSLLRDLFEIGPGRDVSTRRVGAQIDRWQPGLRSDAALLNPLLGTAFRESSRVRALDPRGRRERLFALVGELICAAADERALVLVIEDLQWIDSASGELLRAVQGVVARSRVALLLSARSEPELGLDESTTERITVGNLDAAHGARLLNSLLKGRSVDPALSDRVLAQTRGNPLFLEEIARTITEAGGTLDAGSIPDRLQLLLQSRLDALPTSERSGLLLASVLGTEFGDAVLSALWGDTEAAERLDRVLESLVRRGLIEPLPGGSGRYAFHQSLMQEVAYESLAFRRRRALHATVAAHLESAYADDLTSWVEALAYHFEREGNGPKTFQYAVAAGDKSRDAFAHEQAIAFYETAIDASRRLTGRLGQHRSYVSERIGDCFDTWGRHHEAVESYKRALRTWRGAGRGAGGTGPALPELVAVLAADQPSLAREALLCHRVAVAYERSAAYGLSLKWLAAAEAALPRGQPLLASRVQVGQGVALMRQGAIDAALPHARTGLRMAKRAEDAAQEAYAHDMLASIYQDSGKLRRAATQREAAITLYERTDNLPGLLVAHNNLGSSYQLLGELESAARHYDSALDVGATVGNEVSLAVIRNNLGEVRLAQGRSEDATAHFEAALASLATRPERQDAAGLVAINLARALQQRGHLAEAAGQLSRAMELLRKAGARPLLVEAQTQQASLALAGGKLATARRIAAHNLNASREMGLALEEVRCLRILGQVAMGRCQFDRAEKFLREGSLLSKSMRADFETALSLQILARTYAERDEPGDQRRAQRDEARAARTFARLGVVRPEIVGSVSGSRSVD